ncbi:Ubiquinone biosynthesis protein [Candidatus Terasakiella magnetica]|uniref:Ubiquinone biosynthesis protein n=1 Tax=Candidatus Terasakiella magnetica TaxID=1867952 RepID=A0A1C3REQ2_9PROT|nr:COQ9 family protein [Candidatus Terasakiella magnetica]SCA55735.1 Ubiquinone biosynthesis protein [Candidatus Terasakiella magnetica]
MQDIKVKDEILLGTLPNVIFDGWTDSAVEEGAIEAGYDASMAVRAFPYGISDVLAHFADYINRQMAAKLEETDLEKMGVGQRLEAAMRIRLEIEGPYREAVRKAMSHYALVQNAPEGVAVVWKAVDEMWWCCGDESVDFNYYTKRASLAAVYSATMVFWLNDESENAEETILFYRRRLMDVIAAVKTRKKIFSKIEDVFCKLTGHGGAAGLMKR